MKSGISLSELASELERRKASKKDFIANTRALKMLDDGRLEADSIPERVKQFDVNEIAHNQIATRLGIPLKYYNRMKQSDGALLAENVNHWFDRQPENRMIRVLDNRLRAFMSARYQRIENEEIAHVALPILLAQEGVMIESCQITESKMYIKAVFSKVEAEVIKGDIVQAGIAISNSEVGMGSVKIEPLIFRLVCLNGLILNDSKFSARHIGSRADNTENVYELLTDETKQADDKAILLKCRDIINASFSEINFHRHVQMMRDATQDNMQGNPVEAVKILSKNAGLNEFEEGSILRNLINGADLSRYGLMNAVTRTAQDIESYDRATDLEVLGGNILQFKKNEWNEYALAA